MRRVGDVVVETIAGESAKFNAPIVLLHGLWCTAAVWRPFMGYLGHRGWTCHAPNLVGGGAGSARPLSATHFADYLDDVRAVLAHCDSPPVVVGHDLGGILALCCGAPAVRAIVAMAPLVPRAIGGRSAVMLGLRMRWAQWRALPIPPPRGRRASVHFGAVRTPLRPDSALVMRDLDAASFDFLNRSMVPRLVVAGGRDAVSPPNVVRGLAEAVTGVFRIATNASHAMPWESGWEQRVSELHRWIVQALGEPLLALREDEDEGAE